MGTARGSCREAHVFLKDEPEEYLDSTTVLYPFSLIFPGNKPRTYYSLNKEDKEKWEIFRNISKLSGCPPENSSKHGTSTNKGRNVMKVATKRHFVNVTTAQTMGWKGEQDFLYSSVN